MVVKAVTLAVDSVSVSGTLLRAAAGGIEIATAPLVNRHGDRCPVIWPLTWMPVLHGPGIKSAANGTALIHYQVRVVPIPSKINAQARARVRAQKVEPFL